MSQPVYLLISLSLYNYCNALSVNHSLTLDTDLESQVTNLDLLQEVNLKHPQLSFLLDKFPQYMQLLAKELQQNNPPAKYCLTLTLRRESKYQGFLPHQQLYDSVSF